MAVNQNLSYVTIFGPFLTIYLAFSIDSSSAHEFNSIPGDEDKMDYPVGDPVCKLPKAKGLRCSTDMPKVQVSAIGP